METKHALLELRQRLHLSQDEFAEKLSLTRQAVSRWENGETIPSTDTLKRIAQTFQVSVDYLLGYPAAPCQSCGMLLTTDSDKGTELDGSPSETYCAFCYQGGKFVQELTLGEMVEHNLLDLDQWNASMGLHLSEQEAREQLMAYLPTLARWQKK